MYKDFFGLTGKPFQLSPDARFFFPSKEHKRALAFLKYGLGQGDGFIVITGDIGTGKTTLVQTLLADLDPNEAVVANLVTTQLREDDLLTLVAYQFGLRPNGPGKAMLLRDLELFFLHRTRERKRVLLIVDEAQNLPPASVEELRMLSNFQYQGRPLVQVFLLGQQEFRGTLLSDGFEQLRQRIIATYHLNPLDAAETRAYVEHRLNLVGWHRDPSLTDDAFERIYGFSEGVPRRVNNLCDRTFLYAFLEELHHIDGEVVRLVGDEIGNEFVGADLDKSKGGSPASEPVNQPLESMARMMFDKANVQQRLASLERAVDTLGHGLKDERGETRSLLLELIREVKAQRGQTGEVNKRKRAY
ncbi:MAG TPA: XrtA/PEP-CTERM system-associated ATPase [Pseudomonadales bacterium]